MVCQCIVLCDDRKQNGICHAVRHIEEGAHRMTHCMDISKSCVGKCNTREQRTGQHRLCGFEIGSARHETADIFTDQFHRFFCHGIGERRCGCGNISLLRMDKGIDTAGCRNGCRSGS